MKALPILAALLLVASAAAGPGAGKDLTAKSNVWWIHADGSGPWMSSLKQEGKDPYAGWGPASAAVSPPGLGWMTTTFPLAPATTRDLQLDTSKKITMDVWVGGGAAGLIFVTPALLVDGKVLASGEELSGYFVDGGLLHFTWTLTPLLAKVPKGAEVEWEFRTSGAYESTFYWMDGNARTSVTLPVK